VESPSRMHSAKLTYFAQFWAHPSLLILGPFTLATSS
jgi:hypothetical protein